MTSDEATLKVIEALEAADVAYMLVGSLSSNYYGVARSTNDADFVVQLASKKIRSVVEHLGPEFNLDPQLTFETITNTTRYILNVARISFRIELFRLSDDAHDEKRFSRRRQVRLGHLNHDVFLPAVEDVIITKLRWAANAQRGKDRDDVRDCIAVQADNIDWPYVHCWCDRHATRDLLEEIRRSIPPI